MISGAVIRKFRTYQESQFGQIVFRLKNFQTLISDEGLLFKKYYYFDKKEQNKNSAGNTFWWIWYEIVAFI